MRAEALALKDRAKAQRADALARNAPFLEYVRRWEPGQAAGEGTNDLKRRLGSLQDENGVLTVECSDYHDQHHERFYLPQWVSYTRMVRLCRTPVPPDAAWTPWVQQQSQVS
jgi:hypothetical protein